MYIHTHAMFTCQDVKVRDLLNTATEMLEEGVPSTVASTQSNVPVASTQSNVPVASTQSNVPVASTQSNVPVASTQSNVPVAYSNSDAAAHVDGDATVGMSGDATAKNNATVLSDMGDATANRHRVERDATATTQGDATATTQGDATGQNSQTEHSNTDLPAWAWGVYTCLYFLRACMHCHIFWYTYIYIYMYLHAYIHS
jgi:hypothetical protein